MSKRYVDEILSLQHTTLVEDLRAILRDGIENKERILEECNAGTRDFETCNFPFFAMRFLAIIGAEVALDEMLDYYRLPDPYFHDLYFQDWVEDDYILFYPFVKDKLSVYFAYFQEPGLNWYARATLLELAQRMYVSVPNRRAEIREHFEILVAKLIDPATDESVADPEFTSSLVVHLMDTHDPAFLSLVEQLYAAGLVYDSYGGDITAIRQHFLSPRGRLDVLELPRSPYDYFPKPPVAVVPPPRAAKLPQAIGRSFGRKVGRNEPCPCGSGKKYKKCCG